MPKKKNLVNSVLFLLYKNGKTVLHNIFVAEIVVKSIINKRELELELENFNTQG